MEVSRRLATRLAHEVRASADAANVADVIVSTWQEIGAALRPLIGPGGVAALYIRSIHLTGLAHPWLAVAHEPVPAAMDLAALRSVLAQQSSTDAAAGGFALLETIYALLTNLIGSSLTDQLLGFREHAVARTARAGHDAMSTKVSINRLATGVPGLDDVLGGGLPELSFNVLAGPPGCGKTTLAHQMMFALATPERPALYLTVLGESPLKMLRYEQQFDFFDGERIHRSIHFANMTDDALAGDLGLLLRRIVAEVEAHHPSFVFVDSFCSLVLMNRTEMRGDNALQQFVQQLGMLMTTWQATTFLIGEFPEGEANAVFTVADGLIWLRQSVQRNSMVRKMEITKMRGQPTMPGLHTFRIDAAGIHVFALALPPSPGAVPTVTGAIADRSGPRLLMGVARLDEMLGGGLPRGYSLLVAGPSGSGKSIMAAAFLAEGARCGQTGVIAAFEQHPNRSRNGLLAGLIKSGRVGLVDSRAPDLSIDEIMHVLVSEIRRLDATRVVIDSLSGFELALAPTFRADFRESLSRMVGALAAVGVSVLMTSELEDRYTDLRFSPYGTAFMTDSIIVQRYIEIDSRLLRVLAVVKVRDSAHSNELRLFSIDDDGIQIGNMLPDQEGLLGGRPTKKPEREPLLSELAAGNGEPTRSVAAR